MVFEFVSDAEEYHLSVEFMDTPYRTGGTMRGQGQGVRCDACGKRSRRCKGERMVAAHHTLKTPESIGEYSQIRCC